MNDFGILADTALGIEAILGEAKHHPDVSRVIDLVQSALIAQRYEIGRAIRAEARAFRRDGFCNTPRNTSLTYDGGLRRAARIAEDGRR